MDMKKVIYTVAAIFVVAGFSSCKPKESAYKAAMERAQQREIARQQEEPQNEIVPVIVESDIDARQERITPAQGENADGLRRFSVVIGSFQNPTNARSLKSRMQSEGYNAILAQNEQGMYRVIVTSFDDKMDAARSRDSIKSMYAPQFQDAWILERTY